MEKLINGLDVNPLCQNYDLGIKSLIDFKVYERDANIKANFTNHTIILVLKGRITYSYGIHSQIEVEKGQIFLVPLGFELELEVSEKAELLRISLVQNDRLCDSHLLIDLCKKSTNPNDPQHLTIDKILQSFADQQKSYYLTGLRCYYFHEIKIRELLYIFRLYYPKDELANFFAPVVSGDKYFSTLVIEASVESRSVLELATKVGYSLSGFNKKFKRVFNIPPYEWLQSMRAKRLYKTIIRTNIPFKELYVQENFSSLSELTRFCKKHYASTPSELRNQPKGIK